MFPEIDRSQKWLRCRNPRTWTHVHYTSDVRGFFAWAGKPPASIAFHDVDAYACTERSECVAHCRSLGHAPATVNRDESNTYDSVGNRLKKGVSGAVTEYVYDDANRLTSAGGVEYTWDQNGNLLDDGERTYKYDYANRLVQVVTGTFTTTFTYNGDGHRLAKGENGVTTSYVVAMLGLSQVLVETTDGSSIRYIYGHDLLAEHDGEAWAWHLNDGLGSARSGQLADGNGDVTLAQGYTPFGVPMWNEGNGSTGYGFTGERWEAYAELLFLRARYYEPGTGRFLNEDPFAGFVLHPTTLHPYSYAANNPVNHVDLAGYQGASVIQCVLSDPARQRALASAVATALELGVGIISIEVVAPVVIIVAPPAVLLTASYYLAPPPFEPTVPPQPVPTAPPVSAPSPPTSIPEGYAQSEAELNALFGLNPTPEPFPAPRPIPWDPFIPPCPTDTPEPKEKHISLGINQVREGSRPVDSLFMFTWRLNQKLNSQNIYVYSYDDWFQEGLCSVSILYNWPLAFDQSSARAKGIHFNLRGISDHNDFIERYGSNGRWLRGPNTADELYLIKTRSELCSKTRFYKDGITVSMSAWQEVCGQQN